MPPRKGTRRADGTSRHDKTVSKLPAKLPSRLDQLSPWARYGLVVLSSLILSSILFTATTGFTIANLSHVSRRREAPWEAAALLAWRAVELGLAWVVGFDGKFGSGKLGKLPSIAKLALPARD
jgi:hypothetical protein